MLPTHKKKALDALKRLNGLSKKLEKMIEEDSYCPKILEMALAMQGHVRHVQSQVLESHLNTCAPKKLGSSGKDTFIAELLKVIGLSTR
jgi:CsoR family transcriptional regulator, copper-sensing transcriptional repressor